MGRGGWQEEGDGGGVGRGWGKGISKLQAKAGYGYSSTIIKLYLSVRCVSGCLTSYYFRYVVPNKVHWLTIFSISPEFSHFLDFIVSLFLLRDRDKL